MQRSDSLRVAVTGATGNVGTSVLAALSQAPEIDSVVGLARRVPSLTIPKVRWESANVRTSELVEHFRGCDVVIHLAWMIQPSRDLRTAHSTNVEGSRRTFDAAIRAKVGKIVYASSVGAYSPGPKDEAVTESHPTGGIDSSFYSRHKSDVERMLDEVESEHPEVAVVRLRPALIFKGDAAAEIRRLFLGPLFPNVLLPRTLPVVPRIERLRFQAVHSDDVGRAYLDATRRDVRGAFNIAADPVLDPDRLSAMFEARQLKVPARAVRAAAQLSWRLRLQPSPPGWLDMALQTPLMDTTRAKHELEWTPNHSGEEALLELFEGLRSGRAGGTPPLEAHAGGRLRIKEFLTGIGGTA